MKIIYKELIKKYVKSIKTQDINNFALKNGITLYDKEDEIIHDFILNNYNEILNKNVLVFNIIKNKISKDTYDNIMKLYYRYEKLI